MKRNPTIWRKIEKQSNLKIINLLRRKVDAKNVSTLVNLHQDFKMVKQVLIEQRCLNLSILPNTKAETFQRRLSFEINSSLLDYFVFQIFYTHTHIYIYIYGYISISLSPLYGGAHMRSTDQQVCSVILFETILIYIY